MTVITLHVSITEKYTTENNIFHRKYLVCPEMYLWKEIITASLAIVALSKSADLK